MENPSAATIRGYAIGALVMTFFGSFWALLSLQGLSDNQRLWLLAFVLIVTLALLYFSIALLRQARQIARNSSPEGRARGVKMGKGFAIVSTIEFAAIAIASFWLGRAGHAELIPLVIALIVGIHFLPLANIFQVSVYYVTGIVMTLVAAIALVAMALGWTMGSLYAWSVVVGLINAVLLWLTAIYVLYVARQSINDLPVHSEPSG